MVLCMASCDPVSIILVIDGSRGQRVLFRYPYEAPRQKVQEEKEKPRYSYALTPNEEEKSDSPRNFSGIKDGYLVGFSDSTLANILTPQPDMCGTKFELKIDDVLFVGHPTLAQKQNTFKKSSESSRNEGVMMKLFNIVFVLQASVESTVLHCYHDLSKRLAIALKHEEHRCRYLSSERETMLSVHDEVCSMPEDCGETPYEHMLPRSKLAQDLKETFESLCENGTVKLKINGWVNVSFCLPQKVHNLSLGALHVTPEKIQTYLAAMRPYHTLLFLVDQDALMSLLPGDCSPVITRFSRMASPLKSFQTISQDTDIPLSQLFAVAAHLVYWGKATIIYPLCETNVYAVSPNASTYIASPLVHEFTQRFPRVSMHAVLSDFSLPTPLGEYRSPLGLLHQQAEKVQMVAWMLQRRLLIQLHTYVSLLPMKQRESDDLPFGLGRRPIKWEFGGSFVGQMFPRNERLVSEECKTEEEEIPEPADKLLNGLTYEEKRRVLRVPAATDPEDLKLFGRLVHYFRGKQHLEEIMYYENLRRSHLLTLLDKFREVLFIIQHEDPATSCWYNV